MPSIIRPGIKYGNEVIAQSTVHVNVISSRVRVAGAGGGRLYRFRVQQRYTVHAGKLGV